MQDIQIVEMPMDKLLPRIINARTFTLDSEVECTPCRKANVYELSFYSGGDGVVVVDGREYPVRYGDIRFVRPGTQLYSNPGYKCHTVFFDFGRERTVYRNQILNNLPSYFATSGETLPMIESIIKCHQSNDAAEKFRANILLMQLICEFYTNLNTKKYSDVVRICIGYMEDNYEKEITLEKLGELSGYSPIHTMRVFRQETGKTPHEWLTDMRISRAKELLATSQKTLQDIAKTCGFRSDSHFKVLFKNRTGFTPGTFRKNTNTV